MGTRQDPQRRLDALLEAALRVFAEVGFDRAQMSDIAREANVSIGTLYHYVEGKDALLLLCAAQFFGLDLPEAATLPVRTPTADEILATLDENLDQLIRVPTLEQALTVDEAPVDAVEECRAIVGELYELVASTRQGATALERSARDVPELAQLYYGRVRARLLEQLATYLGDRIDRGLLPPVADVPIAARFVAETVTWFARHRHGDPDGAKLDDTDARTTCVQLVVRALSAVEAA